MGRSVVDHGKFPAGALVLRPTEGGGFWMAAAVEAPSHPAAPTPTPAPTPVRQAPKRSPKAKAQPPVDEAKDKALLDAFSAAITSAMQQA